MRKHTKWISVVVAMFMIVALAAACNNDSGGTPATPPPSGGDTGTTTGTTDTGTTDTTDPGDDFDPFEPFSKYPEPVTISVGRQANLGGSFAPGEDVHDNYTTRFLKDILNIEIEVVFDVAPEDYAATLVRHAAARTLPDTFWINDSASDMALFNELLEYDQLADLTDILSKSTAGMSRDEWNSWDQSELFQYVTENGKIMGTPAIREGMNTPFTFIRGDWLDAVGLQPPKTIAELEAAAQAFIDAGLGGADTTGMTFMSHEAGAMFGQWLGAQPLFGAHGAYPDQWVTVGGKAEWGGVQPEAKAALATLRDWTEKGIIPIEMLAMDSGDVIRDTYIAQQRSGIFFSAWWQPWPNWHEHGPGSVNLNEGMEWIPIFGPVNARGQFSPKNERLSPGGQVIMASCANPEAIIKGMNFFAEVREWRNPDFADLYEEYFRIPEMEQGTAFRTNTPFTSLNSPQNRYEVAGVIKDFLASGANIESLELPGYLEGDRWAIEGAYRYHNENGMAPWWELSQDERDDVMFGDGDLGYWWNQYVGHWGFNVIGNLYRDGAANGTYVEFMPAFIGSTPAMSDNMGMLNEHQMTTYIQIITGVLPLDAFDDFVSQWKTMGGDLVTQEVNALLGN